MRGIRVYADTSVFGGMYDEEFDTPSHTFFDQVKAGRFLLVVSAAVNIIKGYPQLTIVSPLEVINDEENEDV